MIHLNLCEAVLFEFTVIMLIMNFEKKNCLLKLKFGAVSY